MLWKEMESGKAFDPNALLLLSAVHGLMMTDPDQGKSSTETVMALERIDYWGMSPSKLSKYVPQSRAPQLPGQAAHLWKVKKDHLLNDPVRAQLPCIDTWKICQISSLMDIAVHGESKSDNLMGLEENYCFTLNGLSTCVIFYSCSCLGLWEDSGVECHHRGAHTLLNRNNETLTSSCYLRNMHRVLLLVVYTFL